MKKDPFADPARAAGPAKSEKQHLPGGALLLPWTNRLQIYLKLDIKILNLIYKKPSFWYDSNGERPESKEREKQENGKEGLCYELEPLEGSVI